MRYFFDTEFIEDGDRLTLLSIGVVCEDGREFYAINADVPDWSLTPWLRDNVATRWKPSGHIEWRASLLDIRAALLDFTNEKLPTEWWAYYGAHDWVALCNLMGGMMKLPDGWPWLYRDLRVELNRIGLDSVSDNGRADEHNALADARWVRLAFDKHIGGPR